MSPRAAGWLAWSLVALASVSWAVGIGLLARVPPERVGGPARFWPDVSISFGMLAYAALGGLVAARRPRNPVGWLFLAMSRFRLLCLLRFGLQPTRSRIVAPLQVRASHCRL